MLEAPQLQDEETPVGVLEGYRKVLNRSVSDLKDQADERKARSAAAE